MIKNVWKKVLVLGIIMFFAVANVVPSISGNIEKLYNPMNSVLKENKINMNIENKERQDIQSSTPPYEKWKKTFGGTLTEGGYSVQQTSDGGYIVAGITNTYGAGGYDIWLIKTDENGDTCDYSGTGNCYENEHRWVKTYGGPHDESVFSVMQTSDGGYLVTGSTYSFGAGFRDVWLIKTDKDGNTCDYSGTGSCYENEHKWVKTYGGIKSDMGAWTEQTADNGYIITGYTSSFGTGDINVWLIKTDENGDTCDYSGTGSCYDSEHKWVKTFGGYHEQMGFSVRQTSDGGYIVAGYTSSFGTGDQDVWLIKTDKDGNTCDYSGDGNCYDSEHKWVKIFGGSDNDVGFSVQQTSDGGYIIGGDTKSFGAGETDIWLIKTDKDGNTCDYSGDGNCYDNEHKWVKTFGGSDDDWFGGDSIQQTSDGGYIVAGWTYSFGAGESDVWLIKTDKDGNTCDYSGTSNCYDSEHRWVKTFGTPSSEGGFSIQHTSDSGYVIVGFTVPYGEKSDILLMKLTSGECCIEIEIPSGIYFYIPLTVRNTCDYDITDIFLHYALDGGIILYPESGGLSVPIPVIPAYGSVEFTDGLPVMGFCFTEITVTVDCAEVTVKAFVFLWVVVIF